MSNVEEMTNAGGSSREPRGDEALSSRRVLVCPAGGAGAALALRLARAGYEVQRALASDARREIETFAPRVVIVETPGGARGEEQLTLARGLRSDDATADIALVVVFGNARESGRDQSERASHETARETNDVGREIGAAAREIGADDCFALSTPTPEILARLDSLFWRIEAARALASLDTTRATRARRAEIEGFMQLLEDARASFDAGEPGALVIITAADGDASALRDAHAFFSRNLRRVDRIAFYGPDALVAHLPRDDADAAHQDLARLHAEFAHARPSSPISFGVAHFPEDGADAEQLMERAEAALAASRALDDDDKGAGVNVAINDDFARDAAADAGIALWFDENEDAARRDETDDDGTRRAPQSLTNEGARAASEESRAAQRALRESHGEFETSMIPAQGAGATAGGGVLARAAAEAAARERERRARGERLPRRVLLTISDPARMAQVNLLLRAASYEVRAAFDGRQALDLLRIERADLLVLDFELKLLDGLEVLRRLDERHHGRLPMPIVLLYPSASEVVREEARTLGASAFVALPYDPSALLDAVRETGNKK
jgi:DNA-binding response OmpR family regulator